MGRFDQDHRGSDSTITWQVAKGILIAAFILGVIGGAIRYMEIEAEKEEIKKITEHFNKEMATIGKSFQRSINSNTGMAAREIKRSPNPYLSIPKTSEQIVRENSQKAFMEARKETEDFRKHYQKPAKCYDMKDSATRMFCANHFMRARKAFDAGEGLN